MSHDPYEEWLLSEEPLTAEQEQALREHLQNCPDCTQLETAWRSVRMSFHNSPMEAPVPGFAQRWQTRQAEQRAAHFQKLTWTILGGCLGAAVIILFALSLPEIQGLPSLVVLLSSFFALIVAMLTTAANVQDFLEAFFQNVPIFIPILMWVAISLTIFFWSMVWMIGVWRLPHLQRRHYEAHI